MIENFPKTYSLGANINVELVLSNNATRTDFKNATWVYISYFAKKLNIIS